MYKKILVPLDGSELAECVLPHVASIAKGCGAQDVILLRVVEPLQLYRGTEYSISPEERQRLETRDMESARDYLERVGAQTTYDGVNVQSEVIFGKVAETIADYAGKNGVDLITIATHGRSGVSRWVWGSVADRILRSACVPVLMVRAPGCVPGI